MLLEYLLLMGKWHKYKKFKNSMMGKDRRRRKYHVRGGMRKI